MTLERKKRSTKSGAKGSKPARTKAVQVSPKLVTSFLKGLKLYDIQLDSGKFHIDRTSYALMLHEEKKMLNRLSVDTKIDSMWEIDRGEYGFDPIASCLFAIINPEDETEIVSIGCEIRGQFHTKDKNKKVIEAFSEKQFGVIAWPYFRQYVAALSAQIGIGSITIPLTTESIFKNLLEEPED